jgi:hypothetical protein
MTDTSAPPGEEPDRLRWIVEGKLPWEEWLGVSWAGRIGQRTPAR